MSVKLLGICALIGLAGCGERSRSLATTSGDGGSSTPDAGAAELPPPSRLPFSPAEGGLRRLTVAQYAGAIRDLFGPDIVVPSRLEPDVAIEGLVAIGAARAPISPRGVEQFEAAGHAIAEQVMRPGPARDALVACTPAGVADDACARRVLGPLARRILRRPAGEAELARLVALASRAGTALGDFHRGLALPIAALLQAPSFLFRIELGEPDPAAPDQRRFSSFELASRLSFLLWNAIPDEPLLEAAARGDLLTDAGLDAELDRMLASPRARDGVRAFFVDLLELYKLDELVKDPKIYVHASPEVGPSAREETLRVLERIVFDDEADYRDVLTTRRTFVDRRLAAIYGVRAPAREGFGPLEWPADGPRGGLLTHVSTLALHAHAVSSSATRRGVFVRRVLLCSNPAPPPVDVNTALPEPSGDRPTLRDRVRIHLENENCAVCHRFTDPVGLGLENFDGIGRHRTTENGAKIDPSGEIDRVAFANPQELGAAIRRHPDFVPCFVKSLYRYGTGHLETAGEGKALDGLYAAFAGSGHRVLPLLRALVKSDGFRKAAPPSTTGGSP